MDATKAGSRTFSGPSQFFWSLLADLKSGMSIPLQPEPILELGILGPANIPRKRVPVVVFSMLQGVRRGSRCIEGIPTWIEGIR